MPCPGTLDNRVERLELWLPAKLLFDFFRGCDQPRRIAGSAWLFNCIDLPARDFATGRDYLPNAGAAARAEVIESAAGCAKSKNMRVCKIDNMNVITNACSVGRLIVGSVNFDIWALTERDLQHNGD